jgi:threonine dehydratase
MDTFAEGIATRSPFAMTTRLLRDRLDDFRLVTDEALRAGMRELFLEDGVVAEGACASSLAAMYDVREELRGKTVVFPISGRNVDPEKFRAILGWA